MPKALLTIEGLHVSVARSTGSGQAGKEILHEINLEIRPGEIHDIMGPNGSGKSSLVNALMGHPSYHLQIANGKLQFLGKNLLSMKPHERARAGLFLAFQYPKEISGVSVRDFLYAAMNARLERKVSPLQFRKELEMEAKNLHIDPVLLERSLNKGFSGGEKKKTEILQLKMLKPRLALLDETDSGLDVDALRVVADGVNAMRVEAGFSALIVTHYARLLQYIVPDRVHVMVKGGIVESGGPDLAHRLEKEGYAKYGVREKGAALRLEVG